MDRDACWLLPWIMRTAKRPAMYFGDTNVRSVYNFITGYTWAREDLGAPAFGREEEDVLPAFTRWLRDKTGLQNVEWVHHIEEIDASSRNAITFYELMVEFLRDNGYQPEHWDHPELCPPSIRGD